ncbi:MULTISPECIES: nucleoside diphosphate kinase regulator [Bosea]|uniref:Nucleoside diphosphate kinase regulator n=1 Tax=Bosea minatitlanensis TaxID=128782 RepID=A0ABW0FAR4_9HYPH|nr:nucleoside diphosphate kinase regulator [Bosea minatitlanensis]MCT4495770.1 nucleoside diphosphate kinase regulator [Bosea minatitlanensis]
MTTKRPAITVTAADHAMLSRIAAGAANTMPELAAELSHELDRARILPEGRVSIDHARIGSQVVYRDESTKRETTVTLVWPQDANIEKNRISVMTPIGVALIGMAADRTIDWTTRSGDVKRLTVLEVREPVEEEAAS